MLLVPKQLRRAGMTGNVPYYGGRFTPAQAYAASHPSWQPHESAPSVAMATPAFGRPGPPTASSTNQVDPLLALQHLLDSGVITPEEYEGMRERVIG